MESWHNLTDEQLKELMILDQYLIRKIVGGHSKVPFEFLFLETSAIPIDFILTSRRLNYLHTILSRGDSEITKKIYFAQKSDPIKGDWVQKIQEDMQKVNIVMDENKIAKMKKSIFKNLVKTNVRKATFSYLRETQLTHTKINTISYPKFTIQPYLECQSFSFTESFTLFNVRANTVNSFKMCFTSMNRNNLNCRLGCLEEDSLEHCMSCPVIDQHIGRPPIPIIDVFKTKEKQKQAIDTFIARSTLRTALLEGSGAYQGSSILDTSTPAPGGAGERIGLPPIVALLF